MVPITAAIKKKFAGRTKSCRICNAPITLEDLIISEWVKTKRGTEFFFHTECARKERERLWRDQSRQAYNGR